MPYKAADYINTPCGEALNPRVGFKMKEEKYRSVTKYGDTNLIGILEEYFDRTKRDIWLFGEDLKEIYEENVYPYIDPDIPYSGYTDIHMINLRNLFRRIMKERGLEREEFVYRIRSLILTPGISEECDRFIMEQGSPSTLTDKELSKLKEVVLRHDGIGEYTGIGLMMYTGASLADLRKVKFSDIMKLDEADESDAEHIIHYRGSFPKMTRVRPLDVRPRFVPLPDRLYETLKERRKTINQVLALNPDDYPGIRSADELEIACYLTNIEQKTTAHHLSASASELLRYAGVNEIRVALLNCRLLEDPALCSAEGYGSLYILRRTFATLMSAAGVDPAMSIYLMGNDMAEAEEYMKSSNRKDVSDPQWMRETKQKLEDIFSL